MPVDPLIKPRVPSASSARELRVAGEIAQAFLTAERPYEVYRVALERVAPLVDASFGCVFLFDEDPELLRIVTAYNWPQRYANYLGSMRVRVGNGPTGRAVLGNTYVEVADVFADAELTDWWDSARELGFTSAIALPLVIGARPIGSLTFYFREEERFRGADRHLLQLVAAQLAATVEKAHLIDDLQRANEQLQEQNEMLEARYREAEKAKQLKNEFLANVSHELRTPLTAILGYTYLLKEGVPGQLCEEQFGAVEKIENAGGQLVSTIDGLLDLTNLNLGRIEAEPELCDAVSLVEAAVADEATPAEGVELRTETPSERVPIHTDPALVLRILRSLLSNAMKFTKEGAITVRVRLEDPAAGDSRFSRGPDVIWEVSDTGIGIDEKDQEMIFDEFRQADGSATRRFGGAGLGLAVARGLARRLGGDVRVQSELGKGATFTCRLPSSVVQAGASQ